jgi:hypothetical protein
MRYSVAYTGLLPALRLKETRTQRYWIFLKLSIFQYRLKPLNTSLQSAPQSPLGDPAW